MRKRMGRCGGIHREGLTDLCRQRCSGEYESE
jgi:hypothetical protein